MRYIVLCCVVLPTFVYVTISFWVLLCFFVLSQYCLHVTTLSCVLLYCFVMLQCQSTYYCVFYLRVGFFILCVYCMVRRTFSYFKNHRTNAVKRKMGRTTICRDMAAFVRVLHGCCCRCVSRRPHAPPLYVYLALEEV